MNYYSVYTLLFIFISYNNIAQTKEYMVTLDNDTIYGKITRGTSFLNASKVIFKIKDEAGNKSTIDPSNVKVIRSFKGVDGDCVIKTKYDRFFIKRIINGKITVYQLIGDVMFFVSKDDKDIQPTDIGWFFSRKSAHSQIRPLIKDCPEVLKEFDTLKGSEKNILYIIKKYNKLVI